MLRRLAAVAVLWAAASEGEDTCPAGAGTRCKAATGLTENATYKNRTVKVQVQATADLITQEVQSLKHFMELCQKRIKLLSDLKHAVKSGRNLSLPGSHVQALQEKLPLLNSIAITEDKAPHSSAEDFLVTRAIVPLEEPASFIELMSLRSNRNSGPASTSQIVLPSLLLVVVRVDGAVRLFSPNGDLYLAFSAGHDDPVTSVTVSPSQDEYFLATADAGGIIRVHKINVRQRWLSREQKQGRRKSLDEKGSQYLGSQVNVTAQFTKTIRILRGNETEPPIVTSFTAVSQQGVKYFMVGDEQGQVRLFTRNGTFAGQLNVSRGRVQSLFGHAGHIIFLAGNRWGFINPEKQSVERIECPKIGRHVTSVTIDGQQSSRVLVADEEGTVWVFNIKEKHSCKLEDRFPRGSTSAPLELSGTRGFVLGLETAPEDGDSVSLVALNMSHVGKKKSDLAGEFGVPSPVVWRKRRPAIRDWAINKRFQQGDIVAFLSKDGLEIEVVELLMTIYQPYASDDFANYQAPVVLVGVAMILGWQYVKGRGMFGGGDDEKQLEAMRKQVGKGKKGKKGKAPQLPDSLKGVMSNAQMEEMMRCAGAGGDDMGFDGF